MRVSICIKVVCRVFAQVSHCWKALGRCLSSWVSTSCFESCSNAKNASRLEAVSRLEAIASSRLEAFAIRLDVIALALQCCHM